ncbi:MAG: hypothetical protein JNN30_17600 [Rhodanobacteraceae bacterium]|nr:hypothetical protein [Rhodanobacteraceae bacterium]
MSTANSDPRSSSNATPADPTPLRPALVEALVLSLVVLAFGLAAAWQGQSSNWDLRNYHWYNAWAWLQDRHDLDLAAAQAQTWFNPLLPAGIYLLLSSLKPWLGTFLLGVVQGLNLLPLHRIARQLLPQRGMLVLLAAVAGATGATQRGELGTSFGDNLVSLPLLCALALLVAPAASRLCCVAAGVLLGLTVGLKLTAAPVAAGITCAALWLFAQRGQLTRQGFTLVASAAAAFLIISGPWMWQLWRDYGNPLFPMFGALFGGEYAAPSELRDTRWLPRDWLQWLFYPLFWTQHSQYVSELKFLDLRVLLWFLAMLLLPLWWRRAQAQSTQALSLTFIVMAALLIYLFWLIVFGYYRYLVVLEMLAPLLLTVALLAIPRRHGVITACCVLVVISLATRGPRWGRLASYAESYVSVQLPPSAQQRDALVLFADHEPLAFLAPSFPAGTRFARIRGNVMGPPMPEWALDRAARARIQAHRGPLLLLAVHLDDPQLSEALQRHALILDRRHCARIDANLFHRREARPQLCALNLAAPWLEPPARRTEQTTTQPL